MKHKKLLSTVLAIALAFSLAAPVFAAGGYSQIEESSRTEYEVDLDGQLYAPVVRVVVTYVGSKLYVNPTKSLIVGKFTDAAKGSTDDDSTNKDVFYTLNKVTPEDTSDPTKERKARSIMSTPILIRSDTEMALNVYATATAKVPEASGISFVPDATDSDAGVTGKAASLELGGSKSIAATTAADKDSGFKDSHYVFHKAFPVTATGTDPVKETKIETPVVVASINAVDPTYKESNFAMVQARGDLNPSNTVVWTDNDTIDMTVVLTFSLANSAAQPNSNGDGSVAP